MKPLTIMLIAGEASGDQLAGELTRALRSELSARRQVYTPDVQPLLTGLAPRFIGAGGARMKEADVQIAFDLTRHSVIGISDVLRQYFTFRRLFGQLFDLALERLPDVIVGVDYGGFNLRFARAIRRHVRTQRQAFNNWRPRLVQFVSPQVWASRSGRAYRMAEDLDLVLSIFPFEKDWYAGRVPRLKVEFVGHPLVDRIRPQCVRPSTVSNPKIVLLPGSRVRELTRHVPVMIQAFERMRRELPELRGCMVLPDAALTETAQHIGVPSGIEIRTDGLAEALTDADVAIAKTGTVTLECAICGVPAVTLYKTSWRDYQIGKRIVKVKSLTMPNLLADEMVFPEFIQDEATPENIAAAALDLIRNEQRRKHIQSRLTDIVASLGPPGAIQRAAIAIANLVSEPLTPPLPGQERRPFTALAK